MKPLGVEDARIVAGCSADDIRSAMNGGQLDWKFFRNEPATTRRWLKEWKRGGR